MVAKPDFRYDRCDTTSAAIFLGLPKSTLVDYRYRGIGPAHYKLGRRVYYRISDLERWIEKRRKAGSEDDQRS